MTEVSEVPLLILDLDGTVRFGPDDWDAHSDRGTRFVNGPEDVKVFHAARERMEEWVERGGRIIGVTNQGGIQLGHVTVNRVVDAIAETNAQAGGLFSVIRYCPHYPPVDCWCRKPRPGMVYDALVLLMARYSTPGVAERYPPSQALVVGDRPEDRILAEVLGLRFQEAADWRRVGYR